MNSACRPQASVSESSYDAAPAAYQHAPSNGFQERMAQLQARTRTDSVNSTKSVGAPLPNTDAYYGEVESEVSPFGRRGPVDKSN